MDRWITRVISTITDTNGGRLAQYHISYSLSRKAVNTRENFWNVYCFVTNQKWDQTAKDNRQTARYIIHNLIRNNELAFSSNELAFLPRLTFKNQTTELGIDVHVEASVNCQNLQQYKFFGWRLLSYKKTWIENHQSQPTSMTVWTACEAHRPALLLIDSFIFCSQTCCLALSDPIYSIQQCFPVMCH